MASLNKLRELREHPNVKTRAILIQASKEEGATTIPKGSTLKRAEARSTQKWVMIWSGLHGDMQQGLTLSDIKWYYSPISNIGGCHEDKSGSCREVSREVDPKQREWVLGMDCIFGRERVWTNENTRNKEAGIRTSNLLHDPCGFNTGLNERLPCLRQPEMCEAKPSLLRNFFRESFGYEEEGATHFWGGEQGIEANNRFGSCHTSDEQGRRVAGENSEVVWNRPEHGMENTPWEKMGSHLGTTLSGRGIANLCEQVDYLGGFGLVHTDVTNCRIVKWESEA